MAFRPIHRALVSVTNKEGIVDFARALKDEFGIEIISTGGTAKTLRDAGIDVTPIEDVTGFPEMLDGRVKTLHPKVHGALLARRDSPSHMEEAQKHGIDLIDLIVVNLYEFEKTVANPDVTLEEAIEKIDIGGPSMLRSAAKNCDSVTVVSDPADYQAILDEMRSLDGATSKEMRLKLAYKVFATTSAYDSAIKDYLSGVMDCDTCGEASEDGSLPASFSWDLVRTQELRYGENPHQSAAVYTFEGDAAKMFTSPCPLVGAKQLQGKPLSYNNLLDADAAWSCVKDFDQPGVVILKHQNPCGSAVAADVTKAYDLAFACDPVSAFGGIIAVNREVPLSLVEHFADVNKQFVEVIIAPSYTPEALERLSARKNLRVLQTGSATGHARFECRTVDGGLLVQNVDSATEDASNFKVVTERKPTPEEMADLLFAWKVCKSVKSNAILVAKDQAGIGMGPGQPNRVDSAILAVDRAHKACERLGLAPSDLACASDAFFPFRDGVDELASQGVSCIIQPGGSIRDDEVIQACNEHNIAMVFTQVRHFRH